MGWYGPQGDCGCCGPTPCLHCTDTDSVVTVVFDGFTDCPEFNGSWEIESDGEFNGLGVCQWRWNGFLESGQNLLFIVQNGYCEVSLVVSPAGGILFRFFKALAVPLDCTTISDLELQINPGDEYCYNEGATCHVTSGTL